MGPKPAGEGGAQRKRDLPATFPQACTTDTQRYQRILTPWRLRSPPKGAAPCSGWSNGTKSVFLRGLVPFNQLQQGWQYPVLGETEEIRLKLKLLMNASLKE
ncbi:hypothetical protein VULLAG_LOCUS16262 [Vulpes lagopus]